MGVAVLGLAAVLHVGSSWTTDGMHVSYIDRRILDHWTTKDVHLPTIFISTSGRQALANKVGIRYSLTISLFFSFLLEYSCFTVLGLFLLYCRVL